MKVAVTGAAGMLGSEVVLQGRVKGCDVVALTRGDLDVTDATLTRNVLGASEPDVIIHTAAFTAVDAAERERALAFRVNVEGVRNVGEAAQFLGVPVIGVSTDYVFNGRGTRPYEPGDPPDPINTYGESKLFGEIALRDVTDHHIIVRTSWVFSHTGTNFVRTVLRLAGERPVLRIVCDQRGRPTSAADLASSLLHVAQRVVNGTGLFGTYHFANAGETTWSDFASAVLELSGSTAHVQPITTDQYPTAARRPAYSVLDTTSFTGAFGIQPRSWREALAETLARLS